MALKVVLIQPIRIEEERIKMETTVAELFDRVGDRAIQVAELAVVVPTFNERDNISEIVSRLERCLLGKSWEVIFVDDDSPDGTAAEVRAIAQHNSRVRCIQRIGRRGLSSACIEGMLASATPYIAVMDADCQHDETVLPGMLELLKTASADIVIGTRYAAGGGIGSWDSSRARMSRFATSLSRSVTNYDLSDPMSGFFALRRDIFEQGMRGLSRIGFKILLDIIASSPTSLRIKEVPYEFRNRHAGESKMDNQAIWSYLMMLADKSFGGIIPARFLSFIVIGGIGVLVHFAVLATLFRTMSVPFTFSQAIAAGVAMVGNFTLNNALTYRDRRLKGWRWLRGLFTFTLACSFGALANIGVASYLFRHDTLWELSALCGVVVGAVWNYSMTATYIWTNASQTSSN